MASSPAGPGCPASAAPVSRRALAALLAAALCGAALPARAGPPACQKVVVTGDPEYPPFSWLENGTLRGAAIDIVTKALDRIHLPYEVRSVGPFQRVLFEAKRGAADLVVELKNDAERREYLAFTSTPIFSNPVAVFTRADRKLAFQGKEDLIGLRGGITLGNKFGGGFDEFLATRLTIETAPKLEVNFNKLEYGRIDYFVTGYYPGIVHLIRERREAGFTALRPFVAETQNFVGWSKASACLGRLGELDAALGEMAKAGEVKAILDANLEGLRAREGPKQAPPKAP